MWLELRAEDRTSSLPHRHGGVADPRLLVDLDGGLERRCLLREAGDGERWALILFALLGPVHVQSYSTGHPSNATAW